MDDSSQSRQLFPPLNINLPPFRSQPQQYQSPQHEYSQQAQQYQQQEYWQQRTSSSRDDIHQQQDIKPVMQTQQPKQEGGVEDGMPSTSDFVKKLYKMLEDQSFQHVVSWGPQGDCFVVKDMNEFTKSILPRMFKHSNFASFVRQLNKYDFHKVKNTDDNQFGEHSWTFRHPDFHADRRDALENIKRKVPTSRKSLPAPQPTSSRPLPSSLASPSASQTDYLQAQIERLTQAQEEMSAHVRNLERNYHDVLVEMVGFQRNMAQQDGLMQNLIQYFLQVENGKSKRASSSQQPAMLQSPSDPSSSNPNPFLQQHETLRMMNPDSDVARASLMQLNEISRRQMEFSQQPSSSSFDDRPPSRIWTAAANAGLINPDGSVKGAPPVPSISGEKITSRVDALQRIEELQRLRMGSAPPNIPPLPPPPQPQEEMVMPTSSSGSLTSPEGTPPSFAWPEENDMGQIGGGDPGNQVASAGHEGLQVYTVGHLMPKSAVDDTNGNWTYDSTMWDPQQQQQQPQASTSQQSLQPSSSSSQQRLRVRRSTYVPGWAVPPRVLLVDDDAVSRKLSSKFLQVFGCTIDVAVDGVGAVNKMNLEKYDLVLMDIVMPKLDGVSATSLIRKFDHMTPIISMTSNSKPNEIMTYYSSGMNDILPKPFTKEGLLGEVGPYMGNGNGNVEVDNEGRVNPLAGMGLTDEQYNMILQNIVNGETFVGEKRPLEEDDDGREGKRSRFEVIE
ncbi:HSF-type DNA-binding-domain-containing protein [Desarmillaria tabescens]|uniref:Transcription factor n=1 Tax=Armillaria tabescens TaxID=1929756 RepID=A0AA39JK92_ARMTA|nr:HSF-type DNA-binding-domain-containing protein [Desarmillaria tabescens]KAK0444188.1 HSF-type DNA-binding-domain-containing protein [Desarmillaria tabescens]